MRRILAGAGLVELIERSTAHGIGIGSIDMLEDGRERIGNSALRR